MNHMIKQGLYQWIIFGLVVMSGVGYARAGADTKSSVPKPGFYGLYVWVTDVAKYADDLEKAGIRWLRVGGWDRGVANNDAACLVAAKRGFYLAPTLYFRDISHKKSMPTDKIIPTWRKIVRDNVLRYGPNGTLWKENPKVKPQPIRYWQIWNEPNIEFINPPKGMTRVTLYAELLKAASEEIRKLDPGAKIIAFNTAGGTNGGKPSPDKYVEQWKFYGWRRFIKECNVLAGTDCYDAIATHPYTMKHPPELRVTKGLELLRELAAEQKFTNKPIWFTEVGFPLTYPRNNQVRDEDQQACFMTRLFAIAAAHGITQVEPMFVTDIIYGPDNSRRAFGFFTGPGKWRKQATATKVMIKLMPDPRKDVKILSEKESGVWAYRFKGVNDWPIVMVWNTGEKQTEETVPAFGQSVTAVDMLGKKIQPLKVVSGKVQVTAGEAPVYLVFAPEAEVRKVLADAPESRREP